MSKSKMKQFMVMVLVFVLSVGMLVPVMVEAKTKTSATVTTQKQLDKALKNSSLKKIIIKNKDNLSLKIKKGTYKVNFVVKAKEGKKLELNIAKGTKLSGKITVKGETENVLIVAEDKIQVEGNIPTLIPLSELAEKTEKGNYILNDGTAISFDKKNGRYITGYYNNRGEFLKLAEGEKCPYSMGGWIDLNGDYHPAGSSSTDGVGKFYVNWTNNFQRVSLYEVRNYDKFVMDEYGNIQDATGVITFVDSFLYTIYAPESGSSGFVSLYYSQKDKPDYFYYDEKGTFIGVYKETDTKIKYTFFD